MSCIEYRENENGQMIAFEDGVALCSIRNPRNEAKNWVSQLNLIDRRAVVIGLGNGVHVDELIQSGRVDFVTVIDSRSQLLSVFRAEFPEIQDRIDVKIFDSEQALLNDSFMNQVAEEATQVLSFRPSWGAQGELFETLFKALTGRSVVGLNFFLTKFGFEQQAESLLSADGRLLSIKDLSMIVDTTNEGHPKASVVRILRELVI